jgi:hypothetical protein
MNAGGKTKVNTVGFLYRTGEAVLKQIATDNGGNYKFVSEADLAGLAGEPSPAPPQPPAAPATPQPPAETPAPPSASMTAAGTLTIQAKDGILEVPNDPAAIARVQAVLERLRANLGQRVAVGSRNISLRPEAAPAAGIQWKEGANGVHYAVINEGQLLGLLDLEQRRAEPGAAAWLSREAHQEAVVGTQALLANSAALTISRAADDWNTMDYNGNDVRVAHDDYLLVGNGTYLTAVKSGRMQHWSAEVEPVRFPGVPAVVEVPAVGRTVKFEKTLLDAGDALDLVTDYIWEGDAK